MVGLGLVGFFETNRNERSTKLKQKTSAKRVLFSKAFVFQPSLVPVAALGGHLFRCSGASTWRRRSTLEERVLQAARIRADIFSAMADLAHSFN